MSNHKKFNASEFSEQKEEQYLEEIFKRHYDKKLKTKYSNKLESEYQVSRHKKSPKKNKLRIITLLSGIAACAILFYLALGPANESLESFATSQIHQEIFKNKNITRGDSTSDEIRTQAITSYNQGDYNQAINLYSELTNKTTEDLFFEGMSYMYSNDYQKAVDIFSTIDTETLSFSTELNWYYALSLIQIGESEKAKQKLNQIENWKQLEKEKLLSLIK